MPGITLNSGPQGFGRTFSQLWSRNVEIGPMSLANGASAVSFGKNNTGANNYGISYGYGNQSPTFTKTGLNTLSNYTPPIGSVLMGSFNFASASSYASVGVGILNNASGALFSVTSGGIKSLGLIKACSPIGIGSIAYGILNNTGGNNTVALGAGNGPGALNSVTVGSYNFTSTSAYAAVSFGVFNNQNNGILNTTTGAITGQPIIGNATIGKLSVALGIQNNTAGIQTLAVGFGNSAAGNYSTSVGLASSAAGGVANAFGYSCSAAASFSVAVGANCTAGAAYSSAFGYLVNNTVPNSLQIGCDNVNKAQLDSTGIQFASRYLPQVLSTTTGINAKTVASTVLYTVPNGKTAAILSAVVRCSAATSITIGPTARIEDSGSNILLTSQTMTNLTSTSFMCHMQNVAASAVYRTVASSGTVKLNITLAATGTSQTIVTDLIGYLF